MAEKKNIKVVVKTPEATVFEGEVNAISTFNEKGPLDILPYHENFISIIEKEVVIHTNGSTKSFPVENGILKVTTDEVEVLLGIKTSAPAK